MKTNWQSKKLGEIGTIFNGNSINERVKKEKYLNLNEGFPYIATKDVDYETHSINYENGVKIPFDDISFKVAHKNSVLICAEGGSAGKKIAFNKKSICFGNKLFAIETIKGIDPKLVYYWCLTPMFFDSFKQQTNGIIGGISMGNFRNLEIPLPLFADQKRIVKKLDQVFEKIAMVKGGVEKNLQNSKELFESYLQVVFTASSKGWREMKLGEVCTFVGGSQPPKSVFTKKDSPDNIRLIQIRDYKSDSNLVYIPRALAKRFCRSDDVMIGRYGPPLFQILRGLEGAYNVALMKAIPDESKLSRDFLFYFLKNPAILKYVIYHSQRAAGQIGLTKETLEPYPIYLPTLEEQEVVVKKINLLLEETKRLEDIYMHRVVSLVELRNSILSKAFQGEL